MYIHSDIYIHIHAYYIYVCILYALHVVDTLLESGLTVVVYSGQLDLICATTGVCVCVCVCIPHKYNSLDVPGDSSLIFLSHCTLLLHIGCQSARQDSYQYWAQVCLFIRNIIPYCDTKYSDT